MNNKSIKEIIKVRHSVRNYNNVPLTSEIITKITNFIKELDNPFDNEIRIKLVKKGEDNNVKLGTYGVIKGAEYFLISACKNNDLSITALGYSLEKVILYCTSLGLGTVWLGGTFNKGQFAKAIDLQDDEIIPAVSPVGYEGGKKSIFAILAGDNSTKRKPFSEIFFNEDIKTPLTYEDAKEYGEPLEMLRLAPSAVNKQPWRVLKKDNNIHFYLSNTNNLSKIDIGIALCHFHLTAIENNIEGEFKICSLKNDNKNLKYIISWVKK